MAQLAWFLSNDGWPILKSQTEKIKFAISLEGPPLAVAEQVCATKDLSSWMATDIMEALTLCQETADLMEAIP